MTIYADPTYPMHTSSAESYLQKYFGSNYAEVKMLYPNYIDAYINAHNEVENSAQDKARYETASDKEIQNWVNGKKIAGNNEGNWSQAMLDDLFQPNDSGGFMPNPNTSFMIDPDGKFEGNERDKCIAALLNDEKNLNGIGEKFKDSKSSGIYNIDPLLVDLDGNGIETTPLTDGMMMDHDKDGFKELSAWVGGNDGILAYDKNNNGVIDNGNELFGDNYEKTDGTIATSGFDALSDLDTNNDGVINSSDESFSDLQVIKSDGSIISIEEAGIASINLSHQTRADFDESGNQLLGLGSYTTTDAQTRDIGDYSLQVNKTISIAAEEVEVSAEIEALPYVPGYGVVHNLHQAMALDETGELQELVESFVAETNVGEKKSILTQIIYKWTGADEVVDGSRGENFDAKKLHVLEQFLNDQFIGKEGTPNPNPQAANLLLSTYTDLSQLIYAQLEVQTGLESVYDMIQFETDPNTGNLLYDLSAVQEHISEVIATDELAGQMLLTDFCQTFITLGYKDESNYSEFYDHFASYGQDYVMLLDSADKIVRYGTQGDDNIEGTAEQEAVFGQAGNDTIYTRQGDDLVYGGDGDDYIDTCEDNDKIYGENGNDTIVTGWGNDTVYGGDGNDSIHNTGDRDYLDGGDGNDTLIGYWAGGDTFIGGKGNDDITASSTNDTFIFNLGDGNDTILDSQGTDTIKFGEGITAENTIFTGLDQDNAMIITFTNSDDSILIKNATVAPENRIEYYEFADGTVLTIDDVLSKVTTHGTSENDVLIDSLLAEKLYGYAGHDSITVRNNDTVYGGDGNDSLISHGSNNVLVGEQGNDYLEGAVWNDTYVFNLGDGNDTILDNNGTDTLKFGEGITAENTIFSTEGTHIKITFKNSDDSILLSDAANSADRRIETFEFSDGTILTKEEMLQNLTNYGTSANDTMTGSIISEEIYGYDGDDSINSAQGNDTVYGGAGNDYIENGNDNDVLYGEAGNDTIINNGPNSTMIGGQGDDYIQSAVWSDTYIFNLGDGNDTILDNNGTDTLKFGEGITAENTIFSTEGTHIKITFKNSDDSILLSDAANSADRRIETFEFSDGTILTKEEMLQNLTNYGTSANDTMTGSIISEKIYGYDGDDSIKTAEGNDTAYGGAGNDYIENSNGNDVLYGEAGNDTIINNGINSTMIGGTGNDSMRGNSWDDMFIFNLGDGSDTIDAKSGNDTIAFASSVEKDDIAIFVDNQNNLFIDYGVESGTDKIHAVGNSVENVSVGDYTLTSNAINQLIQDMSAYATEQGITLSTVEDVKNNADLMNMVNSAWTNS